MPRFCGRRRTGQRSKASTPPRRRPVKGVHVVREGKIVAVLHEHPDVAEMALEKVHAEFDVPEAKVDDTTIFDHLLKLAPPGKNDCRRRRPEGRRKARVARWSTPRT